MNARAINGDPGPTVLTPIRRTILLATAMVTAFAATAIAGRSMDETASPPEPAPHPDVPMPTSTSTDTVPIEIEPTTTVGGTDVGFPLVRVDGCDEPGALHGTWLLVSRSCRPVDPTLAVSRRLEVTERVDLLVVDVASIADLPRIPDAITVPANHRWSPESTSLSGGPFDEGTPPVSSASIALGDLICQTGERCPIRTDPLHVPRLVVARAATAGTDAPTPECSAAIASMLPELHAPIDGSGPRCVDDAGVATTVDDVGCAADPRSGDTPSPVDQTAADHRYELRIAEIGVGDSILLVLPASRSICFDSAFGADQLLIRFRTVLVGPEGLSGLLTERPATASTTLSAVVEPVDPPGPTTTSSIPEPIGQTRPGGDPPSEPSTTDRPSTPTSRGRS